ncbi:MAG: S8 family serine peptidase, partial [Anaerolineae bacterium]|nr:S8 family serine peptidase [Anaerolineae bacterium]
MFRHKFGWFLAILIGGSLVALSTTLLPVRSQEPILKVVYNHTVLINGESSAASATGEADLSTGTVRIVGIIDHYIEGYKFWPVSWITKIMTSILPAISLEENGGVNLLTLGGDALKYEARVVMESEFSSIVTQVNVTRDGDTLIAEMTSEGKAQFPEIVGMDEGTMEIIQTPNPDGGFIETGRKHLLTASGEVIEIPYYAEFSGIDLPAPQVRTVSIKLVSASDDMTEVELDYAGTVRPAEGTASEDKVFNLYGQEVPGVITLDRIGVLLREDVNMDRVAAVLRPFGLTPDRPLSDSIGVFRTQQPLSRVELRKLAREVAQQASDFIAKAGLLWTPNASKTPMIVTDEFVAKLPAGTDRAQLEPLNDENAVIILDENQLNENQFLLAVTDASPVDVFDMVSAYAASGFFEYVEPNFVRVIVDRQVTPFIPNDTLFGNQWHLNNTGPASATVTVDADIDAPLAWSISRGTNSNILIGVIDLGFDNAHADLAPNAWANPGETAGNGVDNDGNGFIDDVNGWDFTPCDGVPQPGAGCGDNNLAGNRHGTAVAGVAAARGNNSIGVSGSCPNCRIMFVVLPNTDFYQGMAFDYARTEGADVITNSWGFAIGNPCTSTLCGAINNAATLGRGGLGSVVLFAMNNPNVNDCVGAAPDISSIANVIAVSRSNSLDRFDLSGFGNCMDVLAPSARNSTAATLRITTTDVTGAGGYDPGDYTSTFNGTSSATPLTAGVAALLLDVNTGLTRLQVQRLLQDTADKIEPGAGAYADATGFSAPGTGNATHGYGRINAYEALRVAAPTTMGGR